MKESNPQEIWTLDLRDAEVFAEALMKEPSIGNRLAAAAKRYKEEFLGLPVGSESPGRGKAHAVAVGR